MTPKERQYATLQDRKDSAQERFATAVTSIKNLVNSSLQQARDFFKVAGTDGARDVLMSASAVSSVNENSLLSKLTPAESVRIFAIIGDLTTGGSATATVADATQKEVPLAQLIVVGYQLSALPEEGRVSTDSAFDLQIQPDGSVQVEELGD